MCGPAPPPDGHPRRVVGGREVRQIGAVAEVMEQGGVTLRHYVPGPGPDLTVLRTSPGRAA